MRRVLARWLLAALAAAGSAWFLGSQAPPAAGRPAASFVDYKPDLDAHYMGVSSCSSSSCHNDNAGKGRKGSEYTTWAGYDRHARAFQVLYDERSQRIVRNLPDSKTDDKGEVLPATEQPLCLKCHATTNGDLTTTKKGERFQLSDGVGCEACHGPAEKWLNTHYQEDFRRLSDEDKAKAGLWPMKDLSYRVKVCSSCHVGDAERGMEVNHDLIAAGHPRLSFEFAGFQAVAPRHWLEQEAKWKKEQPDLEARHWIVGQIAAARSAVKQLQVRAESAAAAEKNNKEGKPWPEFSEYGCFSCHQNLKPSELGDKAPKKDHYVGALPWGKWYLVGPETYAGLSGGKPEEAVASVGKLRELMQKPTPVAADVAEEAKKAAEALDQWAAKAAAQKPLSAADAKKVLDGLIAEGEKRAGAMDWDEAAQYYLALAAFHQAWGDLGGAPAPGLRPDLGRYRDKLRAAFPPGYDSPRDFKAQGDREKMDPALTDLFRSLREAAGK
jgi:hypothetical protein